VPVAAGYACRLERDAALLAALLEAAQSRATEIHGAREDVVPAVEREAARALGDACARVRPTRRAGAMAEPRVAGAPARLAAVLDRLRRAGLRAVAAALPAPAGLHVARTIVPGLLLSELL
jgi:ribosomal protein S12 methylthiotransferase accessory factor